MIFLLTEYLALGTWTFWLFFLCFFGAMTALVELERPGWATVLLIFIGLAIAKANGIELIVYTRDNPTEVGGILVGYVLLGVLWSGVKWWRFVTTRREKYDELKASFLKRNDLPEAKIVPDSLKIAWRNELKDQLHNGWYNREFSKNTEQINVIPKPADHKARLISWMMYWPWSALWTLLDDPVRRFFNLLYKKLLSTYERIARDAYRGVEQDM